MVRKTKIKKCNDYEVFNRKTKQCNKCLKGFIKRVSYKTRKNKYVYEACIKSRGLPGKTSLKYKDKSGIGPLVKGELGKFGYYNLKTLSKIKRHASLHKAIKELGAPKILRKLGAIRTYLKYTNPHISSKFYEDQKWVRKTYDTEFKGEYRTSKLFN
jgi:hypothetical protein